MIMHTIKNHIANLHALSEEIRGLNKTGGNKLNAGTGCPSEFEMSGTVLNLLEMTVIHLVRSGDQSYDLESARAIQSAISRAARNIRADLHRRPKDRGNTLATQALGLVSASIGALAKAKMAQHSLPGQLSPYGNTPEYRLAN